MSQLWKTLQEEIFVRETLAEEDDEITVWMAFI